MLQNLPVISDRLYLMQKEIIVTKIIKGFNLAKIRYLDDPIEFFVDICALTEKPDYTNSVSLGVLRRYGS